jgi:signal peptidase I
MTPTLLEGDYFFTVPAQRLKVQRGDIIAFRWPDDSARSFVTRVVGVSGDTLAMKGGVLLLNRTVVRESYAYHTDPKIDPSDEVFAWQDNYALRSDAVRSDSLITRNNWGPIVVPSGRYFVLGDNRDNSLDSRYRGFVVSTDVFAKPLRIYFSRDPLNGQIRWQRLGLMIRD